MKKYLIISILAILLVPAYAQAQTEKPAAKDITSQENTATKTAVREEVRSKNQNAADTLIDTRIASLNKFITRIQNTQKLSDGDKTSLLQQVRDAIKQLETLKTEASTESSKLNNKQVAANIKVAPIFEPKIRLLVTISALQTLSDKMSKIAPNIQAATNKQKTEKSITNVQSLLADINYRIQAINNRLLANKTKVLAVNNSTKNPNAVFAEVRKDLADIRKEFAAIKNNYAGVKEGFKKTLTKPTPTPKDK